MSETHRIAQAIPESRHRVGRLFAGLLDPRPGTPNPVRLEGDPHVDITAVLDATPGQDLVEVLDRAINPENPIELRDLYLSRVEAQVANGFTADRHLASRWMRRSVLRHTTAAEALQSRALIRFVKELYNSYFRDELYGRLRRTENIILSSGASDETVFGLPRTLLECLHHSLDRGWYGYSSSLGRVQSREALAQLENVHFPSRPYSSASVAITLGGTFAVSTVADFALGARASSGEPALCGIPNYPPMVESVARRGPVRLVPLSCGPRLTSLRALIAELRPHTPLVLLQTVANPTGTPVDEAELDELITRASDSTLIILDEAHETLGPPLRRSPARARSNVVRVVSLSKTLSTPGMKLAWIVGSPAFIDEFYEYASSTYGGPPSLYYLLLEVMARMERWRREGLQEAGHSQLVEFESAYRVRVPELARAYSLYLIERAARESAIVAQRQYAAEQIAQTGAAVVKPSHSLNVAFMPPECSGSFRWFREALEKAHVSTYPGILTFDLSDRWVRITAGRDPVLLRAALDRLASFIRQGDGRGPLPLPPGHLSAQSATGR